MNKNDVIKRLREELQMPKFNAFFEEKDYSEEDYQKLKRDLLNYYRDYVDNIEADFQGGLKTPDGRK
ncbi:hypothetical protein ACMZ6Y_12290 [Streptococcus pluranimalium]|uniref:hypothetical protein n=1 Tax=Streptococcus hyovaginalis TaxID=149015 RepID=UPI00147828E5|nr:hypothetical protein [Streptococcus hyovaginalis]MCI5870971.1 hypothetical protein [Streptococcus sp.]MDY3024225.1 hypothetical protein [Streptococcus hyovaginalis]MDY4511687.1 hypothetical protein [Streptococcus hyovaginalis]MDY5974956.1 hypothetical protein [Streptococcus hyovaginalis]